MSSQPRRVLTPPSASRKRKETEAFYAVNRPSPPPPPASNRLLAGYMAHEYLTKGTLFGERWDPARAEAVPPSAHPAGSRKPAPSHLHSHVPEPSPVGPPAKERPHRSYAEVASLLKNDGAYIPGIVNPTQLARWIQM